MTYAVCKCSVGHGRVRWIKDPGGEGLRKYTKTCRQAIATLEMFAVSKPGVCPTQAQYTQVRDFLIWNISIENGGRPGQFVDMTIDQFFGAVEKKVKNVDGTESLSFVLHIFDNKTDYAHGPAQIVFQETLHGWFKIFIENIRGKFYGLPKFGDSPIFLAHNGNKMESKNVSGD